MAEPQPSPTSLRGLDGLNLLMADVRDGVGPYLAVYLTGSLHWQAGAIGAALAASSIAAALFQVPAGLLVDGLKIKRALVAMSGLAVGASCLAIVLVPGLGTVMVAQSLLGAASAVIPPALAALSLGLVGRRRLPARISRNEAFNHAGNLLAAVLAGVLGQYLGHAWIFYLVCAFAVGSAAVTWLIDSREIDHELARGGGVDPEASGREEVSDKGALSFREVWRKRELRVFLGAVTLFHLGNAAMLPLAGRVLALAHPGTDALALSACIIAAQLVMVGVAWAVGRAMARGVGRKTIFLVALAVLPVRGVLFCLTSSPVGVVGIQLLDGVAAGIFGVISIIIAADVMRGTGRFNFAQGLVALATGLGSGLSNFLAGYIVQFHGFTAGFLSLAAVALGGLGLFAWGMPETRPDDERAQALSPAS
jgi:MFS family permease